MAQTYNAGGSEFNLNPNIPKFVQDDHEMADAEPKRKMFSSIPVSDEQYTEDNRGTSMAGIRSLARAAKTGPGLKNTKTDFEKAQEIFFLGFLDKFNTEGYTVPMKSYMTDRTRHIWYTPYQQDMDDIAYRRSREPWIVTKILVAILIPMMIIAAFMVSPFMGVPMLLTMLFVAQKP